MVAANVRPGMRVTVTQQVKTRRGIDGIWSAKVTGVITEVEPRRTGSWFAHGKNDKYWIVRIVLRKDDGETSVLTLDQNTQIQIHPESQSSLVG